MPETGDASEETGATEGDDKSKSDDDRRRVIEDLKAARDAAYSELTQVMQRDHTRREVLEARVKSTNAHYMVASIRASDVLRELAMKRLDGVSMQALEPLQLIGESERWEAQFLRDELESYRRELAESMARDLTDANVEAALQAAAASRVTARATVVLAVATIVLIAATIIGALIAAS